MPLRSSKTAGSAASRIARSLALVAAAISLAGAPARAGSGPNAISSARTSSGSTAHSTTGAPAPAPAAAAKEGSAATGKEGPAPAQKAEPSEEDRALVHRYSSARAANFFDVTTDGEKLLIGSRFGETQQLHLVEAPLGMRQQLTFSERPIEAGRLLPQDPNIVVYLQSLTGKDDAQIFKLDRRHQEIVRLTDGKSRHSDLLLARDGRRLAWAGNARENSESDVYVAESDTPGSPRRLTSQSGRWRPVDFSPNGRALLVIHERSAGDAELFYVPVDGSEQRKLFPLDGNASVQRACFSADGHDLFLVTDKFSDAEELVRIDPDHPDQPARRLTSDLRWDVDALAASEDRGAPAAAAIAVDQGGYDRLYLLEPGTLKLMPVALPPGVVSVLRFPTVRSDVLFIDLSSPNRPADVYQLDVRSRRLTRYTNSELGAIDPAAILEPQRVSWLSDSIELPALIYRPRNETGGKLPVAVLLQEGSLSLSRPRFNLTAQLLANELGIAVLTPGLRGSLGQGKKLLGDADPAKREQQELADLDAGLSWIAAQPDLDATRIVLIGHEGGLVKAAGAKFANRIRTALATDQRASSGYASDEEAALAGLIAQLREQKLTAR